MNSKLTVGPYFLGDDSDVNSSVRFDVAIIVLLFSMVLSISRTFGFHFG